MAKNGLLNSFEIVNFTNLMSTISMRAIASCASGVLLLLLFGCNNRALMLETSFHLLPDLAFEITDKDYYGKSYTARNDFVVIANPPGDRKELLALIDAYNEKALSTEQLSRQFAYIRTFFKETEKMSRTYKESHRGYFDIDTWENHSEDILLTVKWEAFGKERSYEFPLN